MEQLLKYVLDLEMYKRLSYYTIHIGRPVWKILSSNKMKEFPVFLDELAEEITEFIQKNEIDCYELIEYLIDKNNSCNYFFTCHNFLLFFAKPRINEFEVYEIIDNIKEYSQKITIENDKFSYIVASFILDNHRFNKWDINKIIKQEEFKYDINDYKLSMVDKIEFMQNGFIFRETFHLYNRFINTKPLTALDMRPAIFGFIQDTFDIEKSDFYLRIDDRLSKEIDKAYISSTLYFEQFRGVDFNFKDSKFENVKNITVKYNPETYDKLLMVVKKDYDYDISKEFWHVEIEQLPYFNESQDRQYVTTTFLHAKYYPESDTFRHLDYTKNQYNFSDYLVKHSDQSCDSIKIDFYTTKECHYKVWCLENIDISREQWYKMIMLSLNNKYISLFEEMIVGESVG